MPSVTECAMYLRTYFLYLPLQPIEDYQLERLAMPHFPQIDAQRTQNVNGSTNNSKSDAEDVNQAQQRIRRKNRRKRYLDIHSGYFKEPHLELAGR